MYGHGVRLAVLAVSTMAVFLCIFALKRRRALAQDHRRTRTPSAARSFARLLEGHGFDPAVALATYCYLDEARGCREPIEPGDSLERDLGFDPEQIEHTLLALMALLGRKPALNWHRQTIETVEDLIAVLQAAPRAGTPDARVAA